VQDGEVRDAGVAGRAVELGDPGVPRQRQTQRVLAATAADHQNLHSRSLEPRRRRLVAQVRRYAAAVAEQRIARQVRTEVVGPAPRTGERLRSIPPMRVLDGVGDPPDLRAVVAIGAAVEADAPEGLHATADDTGFAFELEFAQHPPVARLVRLMDEVLGFTSTFDGTVRFRRYRVGEHHPPHPDHYEIDGAVLAATAMLYLTDVEAGGEIEFPLACPPVAVRPAAGRLLVWANYLSDGRPDQLSTHLARAVTAGEKVTITRFAYRPPQACRDVVRRLARP
jgi:hypothetical protein